MNILAIQKVRPGDKVTAEAFNALIDAVQRLLDPIIGRDKFPAMEMPSHRKEYHITCGSDIPAFSIFGLTGSSDPSRPQILGVDKIGDKGSPFLPLTNGQIALSASNVGTAFAVDYFEPCQLMVTGATPAAGTMCGPSLSTWGIGSSSNGSTSGQTSVGGGFVCVSNTTAEGLTNVMRTREPIAVFCSPVGAINSSSAGMANVLYGPKQGSVAGRIVTDPKSGSGPLQMQINNASGRQIQNTESVLAVEVLGRGLQYIPLYPNLKYMSLGAALYSSTSGGVTGTHYKQNSDGTLSSLGLTSQVYAPKLATGWNIPSGSFVITFIEPGSGLENVLSVFTCTVNS